MIFQTINPEWRAETREGSLEAENSARDPSKSHQDPSEFILLPQLPATERKLTLASLNLRRVIGTGSNSSVRVAQDKVSGEALALKTMKKSALKSTKNIARVHSEKMILSKLSHPLIVGFRGSFQDPQHLYLALEYIPGGELYSYLQSKGQLSKEETRFFAAEVAGALAYVHREGVVYRDLKPENVLIGSTGHIKLADFGFAKELKDGERTYSLCGTPHCMAPEVVSRSGHDFACDWWMLGILIFEMLVGTTPFEADTAYEMYSNIITKDFQVPKEADEETASLLRGLLTKDPAFRFSDADILHHSFFEGVDWHHLETLTPFYVPEVKDSLDDTNFDWYEEDEPDSTVVADQSVFDGF